MLNYNSSSPAGKGWAFSQTSYDVNTQGKSEAIMVQGNGYLGVRAANEESTLGQTRDTLIAGTFNSFSHREVCELPNLPDVTEINMWFDGEQFSLVQGEIISYNKKLDMHSGLLTRDIVWQSPKGNQISMQLERFVSLDNIHIMAQHITISTQKPIEVKICSGINGQMTNNGAQHLDELDMRFFDKKLLQYNAATTQKGTIISVNAVHKLSCEAQATMAMDRRCMRQTFTFTLNGTATLEKISAYYTSIDKELEGMEEAALKKYARTQLEQLSTDSFAQLLAQSAESWSKNVWNKYIVRVDSDNEFDQLAIRFSIYHLICMTPAHDCRMGIPAKGLSGEGYKGHSFWDTEIFIFPFYLYTNPEMARNLLTYRYLGLEGARKKAGENNYKGAMYPWEAAWPNDGEVTPVWGAVDIVTGKQTKIWSGFIEQHITCDIALAVWQYYLATGDHEFMLSCGYEMMFETATFWASRYEWNEKLKRYEINDVVGPDEYKEHVNNNAFTNYISALNLRLAIEYAERLKSEDIQAYTRLNKKLELDTAMTIWQEKLRLIYLPVPNSEGIVPQDDTYLLKEIIDLTPYKNAEHVGALFNEYNLEQVNEMQVSKQADIMMLFYQMETLFSKEIKIKNYEYYEPKTTHDSSLSLSTHCILANDLGDNEKAYRLFSKAAQIDLGTAMHTSDTGIHAASMGGLWQCTLMGFAGMRMADGELRFNPCLPAQWNKLETRVWWKNSPIDITLTHKSFVAVSKQDTEIIVQGKKYTIKGRLEIELKR